MNFQYSKFTKIHLKFRVDWPSLWNFKSSFELYSDQIKLFNFWVLVNFKIILKLSPRQWIKISWCYNLLSFLYKLFLRKNLKLSTFWFTIETFEIIVSDILQVFLLNNTFPPPAQLHLKKPSLTMQYNLIVKTFQLKNDSTNKQRGK